MAFTIRDAEWLNSFRDWVVGRDAFRARFAEILASERFSAGRNPGEPSGRVGLITNDVAASLTYQEIEGQEFRGTGQMNALKSSHVP